MNYEYRNYDAQVGIFKSIDPLSNKFPWQSPYMTSGDNPIMMVDIKGLLPGDIFSKQDDAAHDFGKNYLKVTYALNWECGTSIYQSKDKDGNDIFTYSMPISFCSIGTNCGLSAMEESKMQKEGWVKVAQAHTHLRPGIGEDNDNFSDGDIAKTRTKNKKKDEKIYPLYLASPGGFLKYLPIDGNSTTITKDMPKYEKGKTKKYYWDELDKMPNADYHLNGLRKIIFIKIKIFANIW